MTTVPGNITYLAEIFNGGSFLVYFVGYVYLLDLYYKSVPMTTVPENITYQS